MATTQARTKEELAIEFNKATVPSPGARQLRGLMQPPGERSASRRCLLSVASLRQWLDARSWSVLSASGHLKSHTLVVIHHQGLDVPSSSSFVVVLTSAAILDEFEKFIALQEGPFL